MVVTAPTDINLAVYMERLDSYIESQTALNKTLCVRLEKIDGKLEEVKNRISKHKKLPVGKELTEIEKQ